MSTTQSQTDVMDRYTDTDCPNSHVEIGEKSMNHLANVESSADKIILLDRIRRENPDVHRRLMVATDDPVTAKILKVLVVHESTTYEDLANYIPQPSLRTIQRRVWGLRDDAILEVGDGRPAAISFKTHAARILAEDALSWADASSEGVETTPIDNEINSSQRHLHNYSNETSEGAAIRTDRDQDAEAPSDSGEDSVSKDDSSDEPDDGGGDWPRLPPSLSSIDEIEVSPENVEHEAEFSTGLDLDDEWRGDEPPPDEERLRELEERGSDSERVD